MDGLLVWVYGFNLILLIIHEMDSAYWHEWKLFNLKGGIEGFLIIHIPMLAAFFYGFIEVFKMSLMGIIFSIILSIIGIGAFFIHRYFIKKGHEEFTTPVSQGILQSVLVVSIIQLAFTIYILIK